MNTNIKSDNTLEENPDDDFGEKCMAYLWRSYNTQTFNKLLLFLLIHISPNLIRDFFKLISNLQATKV